MNRLESPFQRFMEYWLDDMIDSFTRNLRQRQKEEAAALAFEEVADKAANQHYMKLVEADPTTSFMCYINKRFQENYDEKTGTYENFKMEAFLEKSELAEQIKKQFEDTDKLVSTQNLQEAIKDYQETKNSLSKEEKTLKQNKIKELNEQVDKDKETVAKFFEPSHEISFATAQDELKDLAKLYLKENKLKQFENDMNYVFSSEAMEQNKRNPANTMDSLYKHRWIGLSEKDKLQVSTEAKSIMFDERTGKPRSILDIKDEELLKNGPDAIYAAMKMQFVSSVAPSLLKEFDKAKAGIFTKSKRNYEFEIFGDKLTTKELLHNPVLYSLKTNEETRDTLNYKVPQVDDLRKIIGEIHEKDINADKAMEHLHLEEQKEEPKKQDIKEPSKEIVKQHKEALKVARSRENGSIGSMDAKNKAKNLSRNAHQIPKPLKNEGKVKHYVPKHKSERQDPYELELDNRLKSSKLKDYEIAKQAVLKECEFKKQMYNTNVSVKTAVDKAYEEVDKVYDEFKKEYLVESKNEPNKENFYLLADKEENKEKIDEILKELNKEELEKTLNKLESIPEGIMLEMTCLNKAKEQINHELEGREQKERELDDIQREKED